MAIGGVISGVIGIILFLGASVMYSILYEAKEIAQDAFQYRLADAILSGGLLIFIFAIIWIITGIVAIFKKRMQKLYNVQ
jgi:hypothetical protein